MTKKGSGRFSVSWPTVTSRSCIAWSNAAWVLGGVRLISSARMMLEKIGPGTNRNAPAAGLGLLQDVGPGDVRRHQVGRELDPLEADVEDLGERADHQGLGQARHAHQEDVPPGEDRGEDLLDHFVLADDDLAQLGDHHVARVAELVEELGDPVAGVRTSRFQ